MKAVAKENGELSDEDLDKVAGGGYFTYMGSAAIYVVTISMTGGGCFE